MNGAILESGFYQHGETKRSRRIRRTFFVIIAALAFILTLELVFHLIVSPRLRVTHLRVFADRGLGLSDAEVLELAGIQGNEYFYAIDEANISKKISEYAPIKTATVKKEFPNTLKISVFPRTPLVLSLATLSGSSVPIALDEEGVVFQIGPSVYNHNLPVISGLTFQEVSLGQRVHRTLLGALEDLYALRATSPTLFSLISEIKFVKKNRTSFEVLLFPRDYRVRVRIGTRIDADLLREILLVLDVFSKQGIIKNLVEIDFRTDKAVARFKEE
ncbi:MAG: cell division protein FtsQ [Spirochaetales bacterium]|nr:cell division protein FtsQ [Spirochaetales bacterium]